MFFLICISTIARLFIASFSELSNAEVYYWIYSRRLQLNYYDHPPVVAWLIRLTTFNNMIHNELFVRLGSIICAAICTWLFFKIGAFIYSPQSGWFAALLYTASVYGSLIAGTYILPDSPQMVFWLSSILILIKISRITEYNKKSDWTWCLFGVTSGLCIMSKAHGVFLWVGVLLYVLLINRYWIRRPGMYLSVMVTLLIVSPVIIWNLLNNFITYNAYSSRVTLIGAQIHWNGFIKAMLAVLVIANPFNFVLVCNSVLPAIKGQLAARKNEIHILLLCSLPLIVVIVCMSLFRETLAHWAGPAYSCLLILPAVKLASGRSKAHRIPNVIKLSLTFVTLTAISDILITNYFPGTLSDQRQGLNVGKDDFTLDNYGWEKAGKQYDSLFGKDIKAKTMPPSAPIVVTSWFPAGHIDFYIAAKTGQQTVAIGNVVSLGQYYYLNAEKKQLKKNDSAYYIVPSNLFNYKTLDSILNMFAAYEMPLVIPVYRGGIICKNIYIFRLKGYR